MLPPELRIEIYNLVFGTQHEIHIAPRSFEDTKHMTVGLAINKVSRLIASETKPIFLSTVKFTICIEPSAEGLLRDWLLHAVGAENWHRLRDVFLWVPAKYHADTGDMTDDQFEEVLFWSHREMMQIYHSDKAQRLSFDVFLRPLESPLADLIYVHYSDLKTMACALDWLWLEAMKLGRQYSVDGLDESVIVERWQAWAIETSDKIVKGGGFPEIEQSKLDQVTLY